MYDKSQAKCYNCNKFGHYATECRYGTNNYHEKANYVENKNAEATLLLAYRGDQNKEANSWYLDIGASNHMCGNKDMFVEFDESITGNVTFGESFQIPMIGKILIRLKNGRHEFISNVFYVPKMNNNILSLG